MEAAGGTADALRPGASIEPHEAERGAFDPAAEGDGGHRGDPLRETRRSWCHARRAASSRHGFLPRPPAEPAAVALDPRAAIEVEDDDDVVGQHQRLDLAPQPPSESATTGARRSGAVPT
jgi:hypothetical protein